MSRYWSEIVHELEPYVPGEQPKVANLIKLNTNENPYGPSPHVLEALKACTNDDLRLYPDPTGQALKDSIARYYEVSADKVFVGNGSDEVLAHAFQAFFQQDKPLLYPDISYSFYPVYCGLYRVNSVRIPLNDKFEIDVADYDQPNGGIIFANPNAPTGCGVTLAAIKELLERNTDSVVIVDEAYIDFGGETAIALVDEYPNLLVIQTFSKSRSLAGLRVGFAIGHPDLIEGLVRVKDSFNSYPLDRMALAGAVAAMEDVEYFESCRQKIMKYREQMTVDMEGLGFQVLPSQTNFIFATHPENDAIELSQRLREKGIIVRHFKAPRIDTFLRITVGTEDECKALTDGLAEILNS